MVEVEYKYSKKGQVGFVEEMRIDGKLIEVPDYLRQNPTVSYAFCKDEDGIVGHLEKRFYSKQEFYNLFPNFTTI